MAEYQTVKAKKSARWWNFAVSMTISGVLMPVSLAVFFETFCMYNCSDHTGGTVAAAIAITGLVGHAYALAVALPLALSSTNELKRIERSMGLTAVPQVSVSLGRDGGFAAAKWRF